MHKFRNAAKIFLFSMILILFSSLTVFAATYKEFDFMSNVENNKQFTVKFNTEVDRTTINKDNVYVKDNDGIIHDVEYSFADDDKTVVVKPKTSYEPGKTYYLYVNDKIKSKTLKNIKQHVKIGFSIKNSNKDTEDIKPVCINNDNDIYNLIYTALKERKHTICMDVPNVEKPYVKIFDIREKVMKDNKELDIIQDVNVDYLKHDYRTNAMVINFNYNYFIDGSYYYSDGNVKVSMDKKVLSIGDTEKINTESINKDASEIEYSVKNESIATVDSNGNIKALSEGETYINLHVTEETTDEECQYVNNYTIKIPIYVSGKDVKIINTLEDLKAVVRNGIGQDSVEIFVKNAFRKDEIKDAIQTSVIKDVTGGYVGIHEDRNFHKINYSYPSIGKEEFAKKYNEVMNKADEIIKSIIKPDMSDVQKELAIHDYLVLNTKYDYDNYAKNTIPDESYSPYGILVNGTGVCQGYAETAKLLLNKVGIECYVVTGEADGGRHGWNIVKINGKYYHLDVTWDDPVPDVTGHIGYSYFNLSDDEISRDHKAGKNQNLPKCDDNSFDYLRQNIK